MKYPNCEKYGLKVVEENALVHTIKASEVEKMLSEGLPVSGEVLPFDSKAPCDIMIGIASKATHKGLLIGYKPIEKEQPVSTSEILEVLQHFDYMKVIFPTKELEKREVKISDLINRLKLAGVK